MNPVLIATITLAALIFVVALLYSTVGHAGASGYLAAMALFSISPLVMKPTALVLNVLVAVIGTVRFYRAGFFSWRTFWPFVSKPESAGGAIRPRRRQTAHRTVAIESRPSQSSPRCVAGRLGFGIATTTRRARSASRRMGAPGQGRRAGRPACKVDERTGRCG